jgi:hypothetical protein
MPGRIVKRRRHQISNAVPISLVVATPYRKFRSIMNISQVRRTVLYASSILVAYCCSEERRANAVTVSLGPIADAFGVDQPRDGTFDTLFPTSPANLVGGSLDADYRSAIEFSLSPLPSGSQVDSAILKLQPVLATISGTSGQMNLFVHSYVGDGTITIPDLLVQNQIAGPYLLVFPQPLQELDVDVTNGVRDLVHANVAIAGFSLRTDVPGYVEQFGSMDNPTPANRPVLQIAYTVPEPSSLISALIAFVCAAIDVFLYVQPRR